MQKIHRRDKEDALGAAAKAWQQLPADISLTGAYNKNDIQNVVCSAMGGSAAAAQLASNLELRVPFEVSRGYDIPPYTNGKTLFIACSHSGNTEETLEAADRAIAAGAQVAVVTAGGRLADIAREQGYPLALLPETRQPRFATINTLKAIAKLLQQAGLCDNGGDRLAGTAGFIRAETENWLPTVPTANNLAKQIAQECMGRSAVIYSGPKLAPAALKWKIAVNESAKQVAWQSTFPEFNHNEFTGWSKQPEQKPYAVVMLQSSLEHPRVQERFMLSERLLSGMWPSPIPVETKGDNLLQQTVWATVLGDFVGIYLALLNDLDPTPLPLVDKLKRALQDTSAKTQLQAQQ